MAWGDITRQDHRRVCACYPSDMTDREWAIIAPLLPPARAGGRPRAGDLRAVMDAILFIASSGCQWRMLPKDFPPRSTVQGYFYATLLAKSQQGGKSRLYFALWLSKEGQGSCFCPD